MSETTKIISDLACRGLALILIVVAPLIALMFVGLSNATTDATPLQLYLQALIYLILTIIVIIVAFRTTKAWLGWLAVGFGYLPIALFLWPVYA